MRLSDLEMSLLKLGPSFKKSATHTNDVLRLEIDDVDVTVIPDAGNADRITVCFLFGPIPSDHLPEVLRGVVAQNVELMRQASTAAFGVSDGDLLYAFSTDVSGDPVFVQALGNVMRSAASQALQWQQSL